MHRKYLRIRSVLLLFLVLFNCLSLQAKDASTNIAVGPGDNGSRLLDGDAKAGDTITVTFTAKEGFELISASVNDTSNAGWKSGADKFTFVIEVRADTPIETLMEATFKGALKRKVNGKGQGPNPDLPWSLKGQFIIYGECEGVGEEKREPLGKFKSQKSNPPIKFQDEFTIVDTSQPGAPQTPLIGTLKDGEITNAVGLYSGQPMLDEKAKIPVVLKTVQKDCPDKDKNEVTFIYLGCNDKKGIGGIASGDQITLNKAPISFEKWLKDNDVLIAAEKELALAKSARETAQATLDKVEKTFNQMTQIEQQITVLNQEIKKLNQTSDKDLIKKKKNEVKKLQDELKALQKNYNVNTLKNQIIKARQDLDKATKEFKAAGEKVAKANAQLNSNKLNNAVMDIARKAYEPIIPHEKMHQKICYHFVDELTKLAQGFCCYGYAKSDVRAKQLADSYWEKVFIIKVEMIIARAEERNRYFDKITDHGTYPERWNEDMIP